jgi:DNA-directed RNA polymerase subunit H
MAKLEPSVVDILIRSRHTILDVLEDRGYDGTPYRNISPEQIAVLATKQRSMDMTVLRKNGDPKAPAEAMVIYMTQEPIQRSLATKLADIYPEDKEPKKLEVMVIINEDYHDAFDQYSLKAFREEGKRITFFHLKQMVVHLGRHVLVPRHRKLTSAEAETAMERYSVTQKSQFPIIKHSDIQARLMGLVPGDIVEIERPSPTAGVARVLRICAA